MRLMIHSCCFRPPRDMIYTFVLIAYTPLRQTLTCPVIPSMSGVFWMVFCHRDSFALQKNVYRWNVCRIIIEES